VSKFADKLESRVSEATDLCVDRDTTIQKRTWAANVIKMDNQLGMLKADHYETFEHELPERLTMAARDEADKWSKAQFPKQKELTELMGQIQTMLDVVPDLDDSDVTSEMLQDAANLIEMFKKGQSAGSGLNRTSDSNPSQKNEMRELDGYVQIVHTDPNGRTRTIRRNGDFVGARYAIKEIVDEWSNRTHSDQSAVWGPISQSITNLSKAVKEANETRIPLNETLRDDCGNEFIVSFPA